MSEAYHAVKLEQIKSETVTRIYGRALEDGDQLGLAERGRDDSRIPIHWCFCVQDSPTSPCRCMPTIIWLGRPDIVGHGKTDLKDHSGEALYFFDIKNDATLLLDRVQPISAAAVKRLANMSPDEAEKVLAGLPFGGGTTTIAQEVPDWADLFDKLIILGEEIVGVFEEWGKRIDIQGFIHGHH